MSSAKTLSRVLQGYGAALIMKESTERADTHLIVYVLFYLRQLNKLLENISLLFQLNTLRPVVEGARDIDLVCWMIPMLQENG